MLRKEIGTDLCYYFLNSLLPALILSVPISLVAWAVHRRAGRHSGGDRRSAALGSPARRAGSGGNRVLLGPSLDPRDAIPLAVPFDPPQCRGNRLPGQHPSPSIDMVFTRFCGLVPMYVLGLGGPLGPSGSVVPVAVTLIGTMWGFFIHANLRWRFGPLEWLITTPAFHHWHHTLNGPINRNYASTLPWIDRILGPITCPAGPASSLRDRVGNCPIRSPGN